MAAGRSSPDGLAGGDGALELPRRALHIVEQATRPDVHDTDAEVQRLCGSDDQLLAECRRLLDCDRADGPIPRDPSTLEQRVPEAHRGEHFGPYTLVEAFDRGRSSVLWIARREDPLGTGPGRHVALKIASVPSRSPESTARFRIESEALFQLDHPCIARVFDTGVQDSSAGFTTWIAMEFIQGDWITRIPEGHTLAWRERVGLVRQACDAITHAHQRGVIHRDLKPSNILLQGPPWTVKVIDFGVARVRPTGGDRTLSIGDAIVGTIAYAAPEQLRGERVDARADVYGLGAVLYELLSGHPPVDVDESLDTLAKLNEAITQKPQRLGSRCPDLPSGLVAVVDKALRKEPDSRYATVQEFASDLDAAVNGLPVRARPPSIPEQARAVWRAKPRLVVGVLTGCVALMIGFAATVIALQRAWRAEHGLRAERLRHQELVAHLTEEATDRMSDLPGTLESRREMLEDFERRIAPLLSGPGDSAHDPSILKAYGRVMSGLGSQAAASDRLTESLNYARRAFELFDELAQQQHENVGLQADLSIAMVQLGDIERMNRNEEAAVSWHERARLLDEQLRAAHPDDRRVTDNLVRSYIRAGARATIAGLTAQAIEWGLRARPLVDELERIAPGHRYTLHARAEVEAFLAERLHELGRNEEAHAAAMRALPAAREYWVRFPASKHALFAVGLAVNMAVTTAPDPDPALVDEVVRIAEAMSSASRADPDDVGLSSTVAIGRSNAIESMVRAGRAAEAAAFVSREVERYRIHSAGDITAMRRLADTSIELTHPDLSDAPGVLQLAREVGREFLKFGSQGETPRHHEARVLGAMVIGFASPPEECDAAIALMGDRETLNTDPPGVAWAASAHLLRRAGRQPESDAAYARFLKFEHRVHLRWLTFREPTSRIGRERHHVGGVR